MDNSLQQIDPRVLGQRLQDARKAAGLTQQQVADRLGIARTTIVALEKGERQISAHELIKFSSVCNRPVSELLSKKIVTESFVPQFRATQQLDDEVERLAIKLQEYAEDYAELESTTQMPAPRIYPPVYETSGAGPEQIGEDVASAERARLGMGDGAASDLRDRLAVQVGIRIFYFEMPSKIAGLFAYNEPLGACIAINQNHPIDRQTWSLAHEYGHFLMSRYQPEVTVLFTNRRSAQRERLADAFAECFTMPATGLNRRITELQRSLPSGITLAHICELAALYQVSVQALVKRLENLKRLPIGTWERLIAEGFKVRTAQKQLGIDPSTRHSDRFPRHYVVMAIYAYRRGLISEGQFARFLRTDRLAARTILESESYELHSEEAQFAPFSSDLGQRLTGS
ncbi:MAG TPA: XRE family transcriptional regulator [Candidatus Angelobacter sp.]|jgi:Zn-dependent peptidase ImmA (M78 family)/DNA-binding XRE family transcriptional regulator